MPLYQETLVQEGEETLGLLQPSASISRVQKQRERVEVVPQKIQNFGVVRMRLIEARASQARGNALDSVWVSS